MKCHLHQHALAVSAFPLVLMAVLPCFLATAAAAAGGGRYVTVCLAGVRGLVKPDIVFFGESLPEKFHEVRPLLSLMPLYCACTGLVTAVGCSFDA
jgi:hypothetical protein